jgi:ubiquinone/menaquinone biosynthesis C-methylase UbiE
VSTVDREREIPRKYYEETAAEYDALHLHNRDEHYFAMRFMEGVLDYYDIRSILDVGAGTGRVARYLAERGSSLEVMSVEPVNALREEAYRLGVPRHRLVDGDATRLDFPDEAFDSVCAFGILHHIKEPRAAVSEMLRVARKAIFISDSNNFGQGGALTRFVKQSFNAMGAWKLVDRIKTRGKGYTLSDTDGLSYSYSVFNDYTFIKDRCRVVHVVNTRDGGMNHYRTASHVALLGVKRDSEPGCVVGTEASPRATEDR